MARDAKLGDKMPDRRDVKWGSMVPGKSHLSNEWHDMEPSSPHMSEKWVDQRPSSARMSEKWVDMNATPAKMSEEWVVMKQEKRDDPYQMAPSSGDRSEAAMKKQSANTMKNSRHGRYTTDTSEGISGKGL